MGLIVTWEVDDGYAGKSRPHYTEISDDELEGCETEEERQEAINDIIQEEFLNNIYWNITNIEESSGE